MNQMKLFIKNINPFKDRENNSKIEFILQKILSFIIIYVIAAVIMEGVIILLFTVLGYDLLHGEMPQGEWVNFIPLYGFIGFGILTIIYVKVIEKRNASDMKIRFNSSFIICILTNFFFGLVLVGVVIFTLVLVGNYTYVGFGKTNGLILIAGLVAYFIQGSVEELLCRGFLQNTLQRRLDSIYAILISTILFILPHVPSIKEMTGILAINVLVNLLLISVLFSLAMIKDNSIASACGIHIGWNYTLAILCGLQVSGGNSINGLLQFKEVSNHYWITGGDYGIEASALLIPILIVLNIVYILIIKRKRVRHGV